MGHNFLLQVIGSAEEGLKQIFSKTSKFSFLITEYVERYHGFEGFFTKDNVAFLTQAAGYDEELTERFIKSDNTDIGENNLCD